jgi:hypothetical protein
MKCRGLTPLKKMWFILLGQTTQKVMPQGGQPLKRSTMMELYIAFGFLLGIAVSAGVAVLFMKKEY